MNLYRGAIGVGLSLCVIVTALVANGNHAHRRAPESCQIADGLRRHIEIAYEKVQALPPSAVTRNFIQQKILRGDYGERDLEIIKLRNFGVNVTSPTLTEAGI